MGFFQALVRYYKDRRISLWRKLLLPLAIFYTAWPIDVLPDFVPLIGWLDDIGVLGVVCAYLLKDVQKYRSINTNVVDGEFTRK